MEGKNQIQEANLNQIAQAPTTESTIKQKGFLLPILAIVLFVVLVGGAYYLGTTKSSNPLVANNVTPIANNQPSSTAQLSPLPTSDPTAGWLTYTNAKLGYSFKYPTEWANCPSSFGGSKSDITIYLCSATVQPFDYLWTSFVDNPQNLSFQQLATQGLSQDIKNIFKYTTAVYNQNSAYITNTLPAASTTENVFFKMSNNAYVEISYQPTNATLGFSDTYNSYKTFHQILSSIKLADQNQSVTNNQNYLYLARSSVFLRNTENVGAQGTEKTGGAPVDVVIPLPSTATIQTLINQNRQQKSSVTINGSVFLINVFGNPNEGGCISSTTSCASTDTTLDVNNIHIDDLKVWKNTRGVVDINPQTVVVNNYSIPYFTIQKSTPNDSFTNDELAMWKDLLGKMQTIPAIH